MGEEYRLSQLRDIGFSRHSQSPENVLKGAKKKLEEEALDDKGGEYDAVVDKAYQDLAGVSPESLTGKKKRSGDQVAVEESEDRRQAV
ncbi:MAG TPA: hypothetical protein VJB37_00300 [Patescibacteria group bacterium]|nr:hypothetical protein [Patescibacteria group bacterium]